MYTYRRVWAHVDIGSPGIDGERSAARLHARHVGGPALSGSEADPQHAGGRGQGWKRVQSESY